MIASSRSPGDVAKRLQEISEKTSQSFKEIVNETLPRGLSGGVALVLGSLLGIRAPDEASTVGSECSFEKGKNQLEALAWIAVTGKTTKAQRRSGSRR